MIRWSYLRPRLAILAIALGFLGFAFDPLVRRGLVGLAEAVNGAKVDIGSLTTSLGRSEITIHDLQVADPRSPMQNLFEARELKLGLEGGPLLRHQFIVREGTISGLRLGTPRTTSGFLDGQDLDLSIIEDAVSLFGDEIAQCGETWFDSFATLLQQDLRDQVEKLQSVKLARDLARRWPAEYERLEARIEALKSRIGDLKRLAQGGSGDLLQNLETVRRAVSDAEQVQSQIGDLHAELDRLRQQAMRDKDAIAAAETQDAQTIQQWFRLENLNGDNLSEFLLGQEWGDRLSTVLHWIAWGRKYLPAQRPSPAPTRSRGLDVVFVDAPQRPDFLIRLLSLDGEGTISQQPFQFSGSVEGLTTQPALYGRPTVVKLAVRGAAAMTIVATLDHAGQTPHGRLTIDCPNWSQPRRVLGRPDRLALAVSPGSTKLWIDLDLQGDELLGKVLWRQEPVELTPSLADRYGGTRLAAGLQEGLRQIRTIEVEADLDGTLQKPHCKLRSNLGPQLRDALVAMVGGELDNRRQQFTQVIQQTINAELGRFDQLIHDKEQALLAKLQQNGLDLNQLQQLVAQRVPVPASVSGVPTDALKKAVPGGIDKTLKDKLPLRF